MQSLAIKLCDLSIMVQKKQADMGIPVNEKRTLVRKGARDGAYLDDIVDLVLWRITARRERETAEGCEHRHRIHLDHRPATFLGRSLTWSVVWRNFESLDDAGHTEVGHFNGKGKVRDLLLGVESELCRDKDNLLF